jgi:tetratricopeptide (TPR) repeat protein
VTPQVAERLLVANHHLDKEQFDKALAVVDELLKRRRLEPADVAQIQRFRGYILVSKGMAKEAAEAFEKSLAQDALDPSAEQGMIYSLAQIYTQLGRYDQALERIEAWFATAENPKAEAYYLKAMILVQQERFDAARVPATTAISMLSEPRESWLQLLAAIHFELQDYPSVAATLERLITIAPATKRYWVQLATVQNYLGRESEALATLRLAHNSELLTEDRELRQLAQFLFMQELPYECGRILEEGIAAGVVKADEDSYRLIGNCYIASRETERAITPLSHAGEMASDGEMFLLLAQIHLQRDRFDAALEALDKALAKAGPDQRGSAQLLVGVAQLGAERYDEAEAAFRLALASDKARGAAESYLSFLSEKRAQRAPAEGEGMPTVAAN